MCPNAEKRSINQRKCSLELDGRRPIGNPLGAARESSSPIQMRGSLGATMWAPGAGGRAVSPRHLFTKTFSCATRQSTRNWISDYRGSICGLVLTFPTSCRLWGSRGVWGPLEGVRCSRELHAYGFLDTTSTHSQRFSNSCVSSGYRQLVTLTVS